VVLVMLPMLEVVVLDKAEELTPTGPVPEKQILHQIKAEYLPVIPEYLELPVSSLLHLELEVNFCLIEGFPVSCLTWQKEAGLVPPKESQFW
jgi:hypothetical protein